jgi:hypothetical protein
MSHSRAYLRYRSMAERPALGPAGELPVWDSFEGLSIGTSSVPVRALRSGRTEPNTVFALDMGFPDEY